MPLTGYVKPHFSQFGTVVNLFAAYSMFSNSGCAINSCQMFLAPRDDVSSLFLLSWRFSRFAELIGIVSPLMYCTSAESRLDQLH